ncbi:MAG: TrkH family potassium uptake protein [Methanomethylophilus sp.]|jgi:trk system potassium uptake protein TrkH
MYFGLSRYQRRIKVLERWESGTVKVLGMIAILLGIAMLAVGVYAWIIGDDSTVFLFPCPFVIAAGLFMYLFFSNEKSMSPALGILLITEIWLMSFLIIAIPFWLSGMSVIDSLFEAVSAFTTTGATILDKPEDADGSILIWRALVQWMGGITVVIIYVVLLPMLGVAGAGFSSNEFAGSDTGGYTTKIGKSAMNFVKVYASLTVVEIVILIILGVSPFNSVCISFSDIPTGGLLPTSDSMAGYSFAVQLTTMVFMFLGATNYYLLFHSLVKKNHRSILKSSEFRAMLYWFTFCALIITAIIVLSDRTAYSFDTLDKVGESLWHAAYAVVAAGTTSGFVITDYSGWPSVAILLLLVVEFIGGMSGSTSGGIKIHRMLALKSYVIAGMNKILHPGVVANVRVDGTDVNRSAMNSAISTVFLFIIGIFVGLAVFLIFEQDATLNVAFGTVIGAITNSGVCSSVGFDTFASYSYLGVPAKALMCVLMWLGRMEMVMAVIMLTRNFWSDVRLSADFRSRLRHQQKIDKASRWHGDRKKE